MNKFKSFLTIFFLLSLHNCVAMEHVSHFMQEASKQFDGYSWWVKGPALLIGAYSFTKGCDFAYSWLFKRNSAKATQKDITNLTQQLNSTNTQLEQLKQNNQLIHALATRLQAREQSDKLQRKARLTKLYIFENMQKQLKEIRKLLQAHPYHFGDTKKKRCSSLELPSSRCPDLEKGKGKEAPLKHKKRNKSLSLLDKNYGDLGTPRDNFSDNEESLTPGTSFPLLTNASQTN